MFKSECDDLDWVSVILVVVNGTFLFLFPPFRDSADSGSRDLATEKGIPSFMKSIP